LWGIRRKVLTLRRSSIRPVPPNEKLCYVCREVGAAVAEDVAVGGYICEECIFDALKSEMIIMATWSRMKVRHPEPNEFNDWDNH
jgi:hypothetical protein